MLTTAIGVENWICCAWAVIPKGNISNDSSVVMRKCLGVILMGGLLLWFWFLDMKSIERNLYIGNFVLMVSSLCGLVVVLFNDYTKYIATSFRHCLSSIPRYYHTP